jgi:hypothetical protein
MYICMYSQLKSRRQARRARFRSMMQQEAQQRQQTQDNLRQTQQHNSALANEVHEALQEAARIQQQQQ